MSKIFLLAMLVLALFLRTTQAPAGDHPYGLH